MEGMVDIFGVVDADKPWREMLAKYEQIPLYDGEVPDYDESLGQRKPSITFFRSNAEQPRGCIVVMAGGSYTHKSVPEGEDVERVSSRPDAAVLGYAAINFVSEEDFDDDDDEFNIMKYFEFVYRDGMQFPPAFIWQSMSDGLINYQTSLDLCRTLKQKLNTPVEMHLFPYGDHGQALADKGERADDLACVWGDLCNRWLLHYGF